MPVFLIPLTANVPERVLKKNPMRKVYFLKNDSASNIYYGTANTVSNAAVHHQGLLLEAGGAVWEDPYWKGDVWVLCASAVNITVVEYSIGDPNE